MELVLAAGMVVVFCITLWIIHKQTLHARDMQTLFLQRQQFNFERQWQLWIHDREKTNQIISNLAAWNAKLCHTHEEMGRLLQHLVAETEKRLTAAVTQQLGHGLNEVLSAVGKKT